MDLSWLYLILPLTYFLTSTFFLLFPNILHSKKKYKLSILNDLIDSNQIFCIGHKGGSWEGPQNTIQLFQKTKQLVHMLQLDVCFTLDQKLIVHHDLDLIRSCNQFVTISQINYDELPRLQNQILTMGDNLVKTSQNKIPLLQEVFKMFPQTLMNIELKQFSEEAAEQFNRLVRLYHRQDLTIWGVAGSKNYRMRQINPQIINYYSMWQILGVYLSFLLGLLPFICLRQGIIYIPLATQAFQNQIYRTTNYHKCRRFFWSFIYYILKCFNFFSRFFIPHLKKRGILSFYFTLNEEMDFQSAIQIGCSGIITDLPTSLNKYLKRKQLYFEQQTHSF